MRMSSAYTSQGEYEYRRTGRLIVYVFVLYLPVGCLALFIGVNFFHSRLPAFVFAALWMTITLVLTVKRLRAYFRWKRWKRESGV